MFFRTSENSMSFIRCKHRYNLKPLDKYGYSLRHAFTILRKTGVGQYGNNCNDVKARAATCTPRARASRTALYIFIAAHPPASR